MNFLRKYFPGLFPAYHIILGYLYDCKKFISCNTNNDYRGNKNKHQAIIIRVSHGLEKAFSLPNPKKSFGKLNSINLVTELEDYYHKYGYDRLVRTSLDVLVHYKEYHIKNKVENFNDVYRFIDTLLDEIKEYNIQEKKIGGTTTILKSDIELLNKQFDFEYFSSMRYSIRDFNPNQKVSDKLIKKAIQIALKTPSACNRQGWKVHIFQNKKTKEILSYQNGNGGFTDSIDTVLLITGLISSFANYERNQALIDGGLFSMSLMLAFHNLSVGTCPLNTAYKVKDEKELYDNIHISKDEVPIMMLAVGHLKDSFLVSNSPRKNPEEILVWHNV